MFIGDRMLDDAPREPIRNLLDIAKRRRLDDACRHGILERGPQFVQRHVDQIVQFGTDAASAERIKRR